MLGYREEKDSRSPGAGEIWSCVPPPLPRGVLAGELACLL